MLYGQEPADLEVIRIRLHIVRFAMKRTKTRHVGLDSQCLSYLLDGIAGITEPTDPLAEEKKALLRTWFYQLGTFILTETVISEVAKIRKLDRHSFHETFLQTNTDPIVNHASDQLCERHQRDDGHHGE